MGTEIAVGLSMLALALLISTVVLSIKLIQKRIKYSKIVNIEKEVQSREADKKKIENSIDSLRSSYKEKRVLFDRLVKEAAIYDEEIQLAELGFYKPRFDFDTAEEFKNKISVVKAKQKKLISSKDAIYCQTEWTVEGSKAKGRTMTNRGIRLTARAFNNECDSAISNAKWNNIERMRLRIEKAFNAINKMNQSSSIVISIEYFELKLEELRLTYEYKEKKQQEKEEQADIRRHMREEAKFEEEAARAQREEDKYQKMLDKARSEVGAATGSQLEKLNRQIEKLNDELAIAHMKNERAKSMAEQTRAGHVYVISNIGSFGENIYKIGMTRRLEPLDRVKELGDASVPFIFDVHAMIYSEDAPFLERALHKSFDDRRVNLVNRRKEFFSVTLDQISEEVVKIFPNASFVRTMEARDFHESQAIRAQREQQSLEEDIRKEFPESI